MRTLPRTLKTLPCSEVLKWDHNPPTRIRKDAQYLEMIEHIRVHGQIDPIDVVIESDQYRIVRGHRRFVAIAEILGWQFIEAWVWFLSFDHALEILFPTERMQQRAAGKDVGEIVVALGLTGTHVLKLSDARILQEAADHLSAEMELFWALCGRYGPRVFAKLLPLIRDQWPLGRLAGIVLKHGSYRDIEQKGLAVSERHAILQSWEVA